MVFISVLVTLLDGYTDEPSCLGIPPYISPYARYTAGAIWDVGHACHYMTIDDWRQGQKVRGDALVVLSSAIVPGRYLRGMPISFNEMKKITGTFKGVKILVGATARYGLKAGNVFVDVNSFFDYIAKGDGDAFVYDVFDGCISHRRRTQDEWQRWSIAGSQIVHYHPDFPQTLIAEIETYRGCVRYITGGCKFCMEPSFGKPIMREEKDIIKEIITLSEYGVEHFRLGCQTCFFSYKAKGIGKTEVPEPNPTAIKKLLFGIRKNAEIKILHVDNANPAIISSHPEKSRKIMKLLVQYCTPGNTVALGMESADVKVIKENNLNAMPSQVFDAIKLINTVGRERGKNGMPHLLPGINILIGLKGEKKDTYAKNLLFLKHILDNNLLLRRINIRQVVWLTGEKKRIDIHHFKKFKKNVNEMINREMLKKIIPKGTVLSSVFLEITLGNNVFGRQIGSYPLLICLPYPKKLNAYVDVKIVDHGYRSATGIEYPLNLNKANGKSLKWLPSIGLKRARRILLNRPFKTLEDLKNYIGDEVVDEISDWICLQ